MTVRVGFLGGGFIAQYHGKMLHTSGADAAIVSVHDPDEAKAAAFAERSGATVVATEAEVIEQSDAVYVATWTSEHPRLVSAAVQRGLPVFCEKPLAVDLAAAEALTAEVVASGVVNQCGLVLRRSPAFNLAKARNKGLDIAAAYRTDFAPFGMQGTLTFRALATHAISFVTESGILNAGRGPV